MKCISLKLYLLYRDQTIPKLASTAVAYTGSYGVNVDISHADDIAFQGSSLRSHFLLDSLHVKPPVKGIEDFQHNTEDPNSPNNLAISIRF